MNMICPSKEMLSSGKEEIESMIFAISDIHGNLDALKKRVKQLEGCLNNGDKLVLLGDYIDNGPESFQCLKMTKELQDRYGKDTVIALKGNHEVWFLNFINDLGDEWLEADKNYRTSRTFLSEAEYRNWLTIQSREHRLECLKRIIRLKHAELLQWMEELPLFYETSSQIFVHAGVDEDISCEAIDYCTRITDESVFIGKYPPSIGAFSKDIIAGHVSAALVAGDRLYRGIYFDGYSHFYIDGTANKTKVLLCLAYDEKEQKYYELLEDGKTKLFRKME